MRRIFLSWIVIGLAAAGMAVLPASPGGASADGQSKSYLVLYKNGTSAQDGSAAVERAGGVVRHVNSKIGLAEVTSANPSFIADVSSQTGVKGAARDRSVGGARPGMSPVFAEERLQSERTAAQPHSGGPALKPAPGTDALTGYQWDMRMIGTQNADGSPALEERGDGVLVGIIDTGIDGNHPDIAPNFSNLMSRNFTTDMPDIDGPCEYTDCVDPTCWRRPASMIATRSAIVIAST